MYSNGGGELKWSKKRDQWENSTKSIRVEREGLKAWSYQQIIGVKHKHKGKEYYLLNYHNFSSTTSCHQSNITWFVKDKGAKNVVTVYCSSLNYGLSYENLARHERNYTVVEKFYPRKLKAFKKEAEKKALDDKARDNRRARVQKIYRFDYSSKKGFLKAINDMGEERYCPKVRHVEHIKKMLKMGFEWKEIESEWLVDGFYLNLIDWADLRGCGVFTDKYLEKSYTDFKAYIYAKKLGFGLKAKELIKEISPSYYFGIEKDFEHIEMSDLMIIAKEFDYDGKVEEYITKKKLDGLAC